MTKRNRWRPAMRRTLFSPTSMVVVLSVMCSLQPLPVVVAVRVRCWFAVLHQTQWKARRVTGLSIYRLMLLATPVGRETMPVHGCRGQGGFFGQQRGEPAPTGAV